MTNKIKAGHDALWTLVESLFPTADRTRNPDSHIQPKAKTGGLADYVAQVDDEAAEVLATMTGTGSGPVFDLKVMPVVTLAYSGRTKAERVAQAWADLETLKAALAADRFLGGAVDYADLESATSVDASVAWMAGGLDVAIGLLITAPSRAG